MRRRTFLISGFTASTALLFPIPFWKRLCIAQNFSAEALLGKEKPELFGETYQLRYEAHQAFLAMQNAASEENITIKAVSSYRSYEHQKRIWEQKYKHYTEKGLSPQKAIQEIIRYSTIPGTSRHHWGTEIDVIDVSKNVTGDVLLPKHYHNGGAYADLFEWMQNHATTFGFYLVYTNAKNRKGFAYEPWHFSYAKIAIPMLKAYQELDLKKILANSGLSGSAFFSEKFINRYFSENVLGVNSKLIP